MIEEIRALEKLLDPSWVAKETQVIENHVRKPKKLPEVKPQFHPLCELFHRVLPGLDTKTGNIHDAVKLGAYATDVMTVVQSVCSGQQTRIEKLKSRDITEVNSTLYEFNVASMLIKRGHTVEFVEEQKGVRTPDLLVDGCVEVECKQRARTKVENIQYELWEQFSRQAIRNLGKKELSVSIELFTDQFITKKDVRQALSQIKKLQRNQLAKVDYSENGVHLLVRPFDIEFKEGEIVTTPPEPRYPRMLKKVDIRAQVIDNSMLEDGALAISIRFGTQNIQNREGGIFTKLNDARQQLSEDFPSVIYLDLSLPIANASELDLQPASAVIKDWFRQHRSVAAIVLTTPLQYEVDRHLYVGSRRLIHRCDNARKPIDTEFSL
ncbi:MAG: hypothetical protein IH886_05460 [Nitrospinae bacterium]|nr:hypothetical protein [Nitrospinota bacterium]